MLLETPLTPWHQSHKAAMTDFNGWNMPLYYRGITEEHTHTRTVAGLFDLCHMGRVRITGRAHEFVNYLTPARLSEAKNGDVQYSFLLNEQGKVIDDITIYVSPEELFLVVNAGNKDVDVKWMTEQAEKFGGVKVEDLSSSMAMVALQGPRADEIMKILCKGTWEPLPYYTFLTKLPNLSIENVIVSATGYTGERGYEIYAPAAVITDLWEQILAAGNGDVWPIGLGARDSLRLEAGMPLYGHELTLETTPVAAGLGKFIDWDKKDFIGKSALLSEKESGGPKEKLVGYEITQRGPIARQGHLVFTESGEHIGAVASGIFSPTLQKTIGTAYVRASDAKLGNPLQIEVRGRKLPATIIKKQFYKRSN